MRMVEAYERIRPLPRGEREILAVRMAYPEKFWKLTNHYYGSRKAWLPARYLQISWSFCFSSKTPGIILLNCWNNGLFPGVVVL